MRGVAALEGGVQLAGDHRQVRHGPRRIVEGKEVAHPGAGQEGRLIQDAGSLDVSRRSAAAVVADAIEEESPLEPIALAEVQGRGSHRICVDYAAIAQGIVKGQHSRAVNPLPPEEGLALTGAAEIVAVNAHLPEQLGQGGCMAEGIRLPADPWPDAEGALDVGAGKEQMPRQRFAALHVEVALDPGGGRDLPVSLSDALLHALQHLRITLLHRLVGRSLALGKVKVGVALHQVIGDGEIAADDVNRLLPGPEPVHVNVRMPDEMGDIGLGLKGQRLKGLACGGAAGPPFRPAVAIQGCQVEPGNGLVPGRAPGRIGCPTLVGDVAGESELVLQHLQLEGRLLHGADLHMLDEKEAKAVPFVGMERHLNRLARLIALTDHQGHSPRIQPGRLGHALGAVHIDGAVNGHDKRHLDARPGRGDTLDGLGEAKDAPEPGISRCS